ncbi:FecCD family ABC transporter permease [Thalassotalea eurytherma]|uniref:ABC transporter permease n=1 Tax=Thalassotalea eurytherma TaxID=1144278 RepID=A0ABQ6H7Z4_9GAMM|nr:iron ABC transporter permease [Thalassotalea eurytherma]GLX83360.1 ABC transporter permease [Thalassotalea eurytherma]
MSSYKKANPKAMLSILLICLLAVTSIMLSLIIGAVSISFNDVINSLFLEQESQAISQIIWQLRLPRTLMAFIAGAGLALSGLVLQTVTRNPLADPYLFGVSSGASFAVVLTMVMFNVDLYASTYLLSFTGLSVAAFIGSLVVIAILIFITRYQANLHTLVLAGVALSFMFSAFTSFLLYFSDPQAISAIMFWTLGSFTRTQLDGVLISAVIFTVMYLFIQSRHRQLNAMIMGDETALTVGVNPNRLRMLMLTLSALMTAVLVANCGGIGFVGLIIPHIVRYFHSQGSAWLYMIVALVGGIFMLWVDIISRLLIENQELPIGIITAAIGSLFFLTLLVRNNRHHSAFLR